MKTNLKPHVFYYLYSPLRSDPAHMIKYTLLGLYVEGHIDVYYKSIYVTKNAKYKRPRIFIKKGKRYNSESKYTPSEALVLSQINKPEMRLHEFKNAMLNQFTGQIGKFKYDYVYKEVKALGFCYFTWLLNSSGRRARKSCENLIDEIDKNIDSLLLQENYLKERVNGLGANIVFLQDITHKKLNIKLINLDELYDHFNPQHGRGSDGSGSYISFGGLSTGGMSSGGGGSWGGYGGGSFGGGGSGSSW